MNWIGIFEVLATIATAAGVFLVWRQVEMSKEQAVTTFEDELVKEYRDVISAIPTKALLGKSLSDEEQDKALDSFYKYVDLCNTQIFYRDTKRIRPKTWKH